MEPLYKALPIKGGIGAGDLPFGEVFPEVSGVRGRLDVLEASLVEICSLGCQVEGVGDDCPLVGGRLGEKGLHVSLSWVQGKGGIPNPIEDVIDISDKGDSLGEKEDFYSLVSGVGCSQGGIAREGNDVDYPPLPRSLSLEPIVGDRYQTYNFVSSGLSGGSGRDGLEGKGENKLISPLEEGSDRMVVGLSEFFKIDTCLDPIVMSKVEENLLNFIPSYREVLTHSSL